MGEIGDFVLFWNFPNFLKFWEKTGREGQTQKESEEGLALLLLRGVAKDTYYCQSHHFLSLAQVFVAFFGH